MVLTSKYNNGDEVYFIWKNGQARKGIITFVCYSGGWTYNIDISYDNLECHCGYIPEDNIFTTKEELISYVTKYIKED